MLLSLLSIFLLPTTAVLASPITHHKSDPTQRTFYPIADTTIDRYADYPLYPHYSAALLFSGKPKTTLAISTTFDTRSPAVILENSARIDYDRDASKSRLIVDPIDTEGVALVSSWPDGLVVITNKDSCNPGGERSVFQITECENCAGGKEMEVRPLIFHISQREWKDVATTMRVGYLDAVFEVVLHSSRKGGTILAWIQHFWKHRLQLDWSLSRVGSVGGVSTPSQLQAPFQASTLETSEMRIIRIQPRHL